MICNANHTLNLIPSAEEGCDSELEFCTACRHLKSVTSEEGVLADENAKLIFGNFTFVGNHIFWILTFRKQYK